ncbi:hypothetical protein CCYA_CCYA01G0303 [Cyanidiococcus yangmingshanensis]|nr:hypothetical protein CCYA_CCYA01G0303 [Cyanidiococcus yangmingshanensis]
MVVTCSGLSLDVRARVERLCASLGCVFSNDLRKHVTHILATRTNTRKVLVGRRHGVWVLHPSWLEDCWEQRRRCQEEMYVLKPLAGLCFSSAQLRDAEICRLRAIVKKYGAEYIRNPNMACTHLVVHGGSGRKVQYAKRHGIVLVQFQWIEDCERAQNLVDWNAYQIEFCSSIPDCSDCCNEILQSDGKAPHQLGVPLRSRDVLEQDAALGAQADSTRERIMAQTEETRFLMIESRGASAEHDMRSEGNENQAAAESHFANGSAYDRDSFGGRHDAPSGTRAGTPTLELGDTSFGSEFEKATTICLDVFDRACVKESFGFPDLLEDFNFFLFGLSESQIMQAKHLIRSSGATLHLLWNPSITHVISTEELDPERSIEALHFIRLSKQSGVLWCHLKWLQACLDTWQRLPPGELDLERLLVPGGAPTNCECPADAQAMASKLVTAPKICTCFRGMYLSLLPLCHDDPAQAIELACQLRSVGAHVLDMQRPVQYFHASVTVDFAVSVHGGSRRLSETRNAPLVTPDWVRDCLRDNTLHDFLSDPRYQPLPVAVPIQDLRGKSICISGFFESRRACYGPRDDFQMLLSRSYIERLFRLIGAEYSERLRHHRTDYLICELPRGKKYEKALHWNIPVLRITWLFECISSGRLPDISLHKFCCRSGTGAQESEGRRLSFSDSICGLKRFLNSGISAKEDGANAEMVRLEDDGICQNGKVRKCEHAGQISHKASPTAPVDDSNNGTAKASQPVVKNGCNLAGECCISRSDIEIDAGLNIAPARPPDTARTSTAEENLDPEHPQWKLSEAAAVSASKDFSAASLASFFLGRLDAKPFIEQEDGNDDVDEYVLPGVSQIVVYSSNQSQGT